MAKLTDEISKRRTFAIISHPDAGKTTLTEKFLLYGGAIALGHPIGAAGCRITTTLIYEMIKRDLTIGLATMCIGGGMGEAIIVERDELCK